MTEPKLTPEQFAEMRAEVHRILEEANHQKSSVLKDLEDKIRHEVDMDTMFTHPDVWNITFRTIVWVVDDRLQPLKRSVRI